MKKLPLHTKIIIGLVLGILWGIISIKLKLDSEYTLFYIKPIGTIFINLLKMVAMPLILASLIVGISSMSNISKLSKMGKKTLLIYILTTCIAISIGLTLVNIFQPGKKLSVGVRTELITSFKSKALETSESAQAVKSKGPLQPLVDIFPQNLITAAGDNRLMLQIVFFALITGVALIQLPKDKGGPVIRFFDSLNHVIIKIVEYILHLAPYGTFALIAAIIVETAGSNMQNAIDILYALFWYSLVVVIGLFLMAGIVYPLMLRVFTKTSVKTFFKSIAPAQLLAFSTSSSSATLPLTMKQVEKELGVENEVASFVLPLGATINMDGTSLYQAVAAVFIAQAMNFDLTIADQLTILFTALLASIGSAGVPGAGMVMLIIVLESVGVPATGIALIMAPDRLLDMCRTLVNVTGDATVATIIDRLEKKKNE